LAYYVRKTPLVRLPFFVDTRLKNKRVFYSSTTPGQRFLFQTVPVGVYY